MRVHFFLTMTCMLNSTALAFENENAAEVTTGNQSITSLLPNNSCGSSDDGFHKVVIDYGGELIWQSNEQNLVFSGTFWGSLITVLPSMFFIERFSPRHVLQTAVAVYIVISAITPYLATHYGYLPVFIARSIMGLGEGFVAPSYTTIIGNWFPASEKSTAVSMFTTGNQLAAAVGNPVVAAVCASEFGWPWIFYIAGFAGTCWSIVWFFTASNHPAKVKLMTKKEKEYLLANVTKKISKSEKTHKVPYAKILTSPAFLAQLQCQFVVNFMLTLFQTYLPTYFKELLQLGVIANGNFIAIPNMCNMVFKMVWGIGIDKMKEKKICSSTKAVKISQGIASYGCALALILIAYFVDCSNPTTGLILFCFLYCCQGTFVSGFYTSLLCLAPQYTATLSAISMFCALLGRLFTPAIVGFFRQKGTPSEWKNIFVGCAISLIISGTIFLMFGSGEVQEWAKIKDDVEMKENVMTEEEKLNEISARVIQEESLCV
uniref:MFS domain-containing protein n=1 Tax=Caenorhabditis japonica TaxID=281687 RepID=A0A8R1I395_CAEJA